MSKDTVVAKRYAKALFEIAKEQNAVEKVGQDLRFVLGSLQEHGDFDNLLFHPGLDIEAKKSLVDEVFGKSVSETVLNTIKLLFDKGRESLLQPLVNYYIAISDEATGKAEAIVYTPNALSDLEIKQIEAAFGEIAQKQIRVQSVIDKSLLGGIQIRIGDRLYDGSLSGKLKRLEKALNQSQAL
ncbi:F0F1 ATP synthase subunit delta [Paenibacillus puerhi]|uniref:F0F1 ATP synthase subunit delta n=1 Tax=Paenibacillus puerhi TaxID=2692622 RepID=UPI00135CCD31|nr:F0F1 ATP synthase subunit delta [Paenibacillus puerhi]